MRRKKSSGVAGLRESFAKNITPMESQTRRFDDMSQKIDEIVKNQNETNKSIYEILAILRGDEFANGMVDVVKEHEKRLKKLEDLKSKATWTILGMSIPSGYGLVEILRKLFICFVILSLFSSCITSKKREDIAHRYFRQNPIELAKLSSIHYPVQAKQGNVVFDTLRTILRDSVDCPDSTRVACPPCEQKIVTGLRVDTVPDLALVAALRGDLNNLQIKEAVLQSDKDRMKKKIRNLTITVIGLGIALTGAAYLIFKP